MTEGATARVIRLAWAAADRAPDDARQMAKLCMLDWFGLAIAGMDEPIARLLADAVRAEGSTPAATVMRSGRRFSVRQAALVNGAAGHALDYDDVNLAMHVHPTAVILPAVLALAEARRLSGAAVLTAFVAGYEAAGMIGAAISSPHYARGFHATGTIGTFGAAAACAYLIGLDPRASARALGLAASQAAGLKAQFGTMAKPLHAGRAAEAGVQAVLWAEAGMTAREDILECRQGFAATQADGLDADAIAWNGYRIRDNVFKFHAACFGTHGTIEAIAALRRDHDFAPADIVAVELTVDAGADAMCNIIDPRTGGEAKFSLRFNAALALAGLNTADIATYADDAVSNPMLNAIAKRTSVVLAPSDWPEDLTRVRLDLVDGRGLIAEHDVSGIFDDLGDLRDRLVAKFMALSIPIMGEERSSQVHRVIDGLDGADDVRVLTELVAHSTA